MARNGPLVTLLAGAALGVGLLVASMAATPEQSVAGDEPVAEATENPDVEPTESADEPDDDRAEPTDAPDVSDSPEPTQPPAEEPEPVTYVGYVDGGLASVAVIVDGDEATAYVCDGASREAWLSGTAADGQLDLTGDEASASLSATYDGVVAEGETTVDGQTWTFSIEQVDSPEGLYRFADTIAGDAEVVGGWIVLPDGSQVGVVNVDGETQPADQLDVESGRVTVDGEVVTAERQG